MKPRREAHTWYETIRDMKNVETVAGTWPVAGIASELEVHQSDSELVYSRAGDDALMACARIT